MVLHVEVHSTRRTSGYQTRGISRRSFCAGGRDVQLLFGDPRDCSECARGRGVFTAHPVPGCSQPSRGTHQDNEFGDFFMFVNLRFKFLPAICS